MRIELQVQDNSTGEIYDATELLEDFSLSWQISEQPGKLEFSLATDKVMRYYEGSRVRLKVDGELLFFGWVFKKNRKKNESITVVAYDMLRYLKNKDTRVFAVSTVTDRFKSICQEWSFPHAVIHPSAHALPEEPFDQKTLADMVQDGVDQTLIDTGVWYMLRDNCGTLEIVDIASLKTDLMLGDASLLTGYDYETSIDGETANQIKLFRDNKTSGKRDVYIVKDSQNVDKWGLLQHLASVDDNMTSAQIEARAEKLLALKNRVERRLSLTCIGDWRVRQGVGVWVEMQLDDLTLSRYMLVHAVTHNVQNALHTMKITLEVME